MRKRIVAVMLCIMTAIAFMPSFAFASDEEETSKSEYFKMVTSFEEGGEYVIGILDGITVKAFVEDESTKSLLGTDMDVIQKAVPASYMAQAVRSQKGLTVWTYSDGYLEDEDGGYKLYIASQGLQATSSIFKQREIVYNSDYRIMGSAGVLNKAGKIVWGGSALYVCDNSDLNYTTDVLVDAGQVILFEKVSEDEGVLIGEKYEADFKLLGEEASFVSNHYYSEEQEKFEKCIEEAKETVSTATEAGQAPAAVENVKKLKESLITIMEYTSVTDMGKANIKKAKAGKKKITVKWQTSANFDGFAIQINPKKKGWSTVQYVPAGTKKTTVKGLKKGKTQVRVVGYKVIREQNVFGTPSKVKTVKVK